MQDEYLTSVSGYVKYDCSEFPCVSQLTFTTNLGKTYGPYGGGVEPFEVNVEYDEIKGFFGQATTEYLTAFGVYYSDYKIDIWFDTSLSIIEFQLRIHNKYFFFIRFFYVILKTLCLIKIFNLIIFYLKNERKYLFLIDAFLMSKNFDQIFYFYIIRYYSLSHVYMTDSFIVIRYSQNYLLCLFYKIISLRYQHHVEIHQCYFIIQSLQFFNQHHVDSKCSEILFSCMTKEALNLVIFYVDFEKGSTPTSIWTVCLCKIGGKRELRYTWKFRTVVFDIPRNGGEVLVGGRGRQKNRCMDGWRSERHAWNSSPPGPPYLGVTRVVPSMSKVILMEFTHEAAPMLMPVILSAGSMAQRDSLPHGRLGTPPRACAAVLIWLEACTTMHHPSQTT
ncbi:unnamed protein product [Musa acuminata var. zebrina]